MGAARSLWLQEALREETDAGDSPELLEDIEADVCIVGGGYTGLWAALRAKQLQPDASVVVIEADICGGGPSGRNGGFALSWWPKIETLQKRVGKEEALTLAKASQDDRRSRRVPASAKGSMRISTAEAGSGRPLPLLVGSWKVPVIAGGIRRAAVPASERRRGAGRTGSPVHLGAAYEEGAAIVQPALLARGLRRVALARGVRIHERTAMIDLDREGGVVRTPSGSVKAGAIVLGVERVGDRGSGALAPSSRWRATSSRPRRCRRSSRRAAGSEARRSRTAA